MTAITVSPATDILTPVTYARAEKWVIDDSERLHILGDSGNLASYNRNSWASVEFASKSTTE